MIQVIRSHLQRKRIRYLLVWLAVTGGVFSLAGLVWAEPGSVTETAVLSPSAADSFLVQQAVQQDATAQADDEACLLCHEDTDAVIMFDSGESFAARVDTAVLAHSAHGDDAAEPLNCTGCHDVNAYQYPHEPIETADYRTYQLERASSCENCHATPHLTSHPGLESDTAVGCTDCHGSHDVLTVDQIRTGETTSKCVACHTDVGVPFTDGSQLTDMIQAGLFATYYETTDYCLACHSQPNLELSFPDGSVISATIDENGFHDSVHRMVDDGEPLECAGCHEGKTFPHQPVAAANAREYSLEMVSVCADCHAEKVHADAEDVHTLALAEGTLEAAVCTDCHGAHSIPIPNQPRRRISQTCEKCHSTIYSEYAESVHGEALLIDSNEDVPTCIDCHGVHTIGDPTTALFRVRSPELCAGCHADTNLMAKYEISTEVFETYVADFHGTTVELFEHEDPNVETNKAVCYDCHGVHNIKAPDDPQAGIKANLLETCQQCHPDANENFPASWTSHFQPSLEHNPLVYLVNLFYQIVIPATVGLFAFLVLTDVYRRVRMRVRK
ncbi:MAG: cytochrome c3 family protein [Anaerolineales bacterium]|nr:cytochrome c3 family protein [Anaerolineales bacterium]